MSAVYDRTIKALRHAWLNLLDKCMTTGRINQINIDRQYNTKFPKVTENH